MLTNQKQISAKKTKERTWKIKQNHLWDTGPILIAKMYNMNYLSSFRFKPKFQTNINLKKKKGKEE